MGMCPYYNNGKLDISRQDCGDRRARNAHHGESEFAEDQQPVEHKVHQNGGDAGLHGQHSLAGLAQGSYIRAGDGKGDKAYKHYHKIGLALAEGNGKVARIRLMEIERQQLVIKEHKYAYERNAQQRAEDELETEGLADAFAVARTEELGAEDAGARDTAEYTEVKYENQLVGDGNA